MHSKKLAKISIKKGAIQKIKEFSALISLLKKRKLNIVVEIGTAKGGSFYTWCKISEPTATIISLDLPGKAFNDSLGQNKWKQLKKYGKKNQQLHFLFKNSHLTKTKNELAKILQGEKIDFLMIDGDHTFSGVKKDWELYSPLVREDGIIAFHDIVHHPKVPHCRVNKLWAILKNKYKHKEIIDDKSMSPWGPWGGIGVIYYKTTK
ncbi:MAG TPA: class I SAM-dependent methyltransferase [bacterium]|nr:class I SAM-dependent methyltransferase [bacterium]